MEEMPLSCRAVRGFEVTSREPFPRPATQINYCAGRLHQGSIPPTFEDDPLFLRVHQAVVGVLRYHRSAISDADAITTAFAMLSLMSTKP